MKKYILFSLVLSAAVILGFFLWQGSGQAPVRVRSTAVKTDTLVDRVRAVGNVMSGSCITIRLPETVRIKEVLATDGDAVEKDKILATIDLTAMEDEIKRIRLELEQAEIERQEALNRLEASERTYADPSERKLYLARIKADYEAAVLSEQSVRRDYEITKELHDIGAESKVRLQQARDKVLQAELAAKKAGKELEEARRGVESKEITSANKEKLAAAYQIAARKKELVESRLQFAKSRLSRMEIRSPMDGTVTRVSIEPGMLIPVGQAVMEICDLEKLWVRASLDEIDAGRIKKGQELTVRFEAFGDRQFEGKILKVSPRAEVRNGRNVVEAIAELDSSDGLLKIGNQVDLEIMVGEKQNVLTVPLDALYYDKGPFVWVVEDGGVRKKTVEIGITDRDRVRIVKGLEQGERIIPNAGYSLRDGDRVIDEGLDVGSP